MSKQSEAATTAIGWRWITPGLVPLLLAPVFLVLLMTAYVFFKDVYQPGQ